MRIINNRSATKIVKTNHFFICIFLIIFIGALGAQNNRFEQFTKDNGLPSSSINSIVQDTNGFIWIGTNGGLCVFDGYYFKTYLNIEGDSTTIPSNRVDHLLIDNDHNIVVTTRKGVCKYLPNSDNFIPYLHRAHQWITSTVQDIYGNYYVSQKSWNVNIHDKNGERIGIFSVTDSDQTKMLVAAISKVMCDSKGKVWVGTLGDGIYIYNPNDESHINLRHIEGDPSSIADNRINGIYEDVESEMVWLSTNNGLSKINLNTMTIESIPSNGTMDYSYKITQDNNGLIWVSKGPSIYNFNPETLEINNFVHNEFDNSTISSGNFLDIFPDKDGNIWLGGANTNLNILTHNYRNFKAIKRIPGVPNTLSNKKIINVTEDEYNRFWIATDNGLNIWNPLNNGIELVPVGNEETSLRNNRITGFYKDSDGTIFLTGFGLGIQQWTGNEYNFKTISNQEKIPTNTILNIVKDSKGNFWCITKGSGVFMYNPIQDTVIRNITDEDAWGSMSNAFLDCIFIDEHDRVFVGGQGMLKIDLDSSLSQRYTNEITGKYVHSIIKDKDGIMWLGTTNGLNRFDSKTNQFGFFGANYNIPEEIMGIVQDKVGTLWLSSLSGIVKFNPTDSTTQLFDKSDGLPDNEFSVDAKYLSSDGSILFGGINGLSYFKPEEIRKNPNPPIVQLTGIKLFNDYLAIDKDGILKKDIKFTKKLKFKHNQNSITIDYVGINFYQPQKNNYEYIIEGLDDNWIKADNRQQAVYTNIKHGKYIFKVRAANSDGKWSDEKTLEIIIRPPFWKTWIFRIIVILLVGYGIRKFIKYREQSAKEQKEFLEKKVKEGEELISEKMIEVEKQQEELRLRDIREHDMNFMNSGLAIFSDIISKYKDGVEQLTQSVIVELVDYLQVEQGIFYVVNTDPETDEEVLEIKGVFGSDEEKLQTKTFYLNEGVVGVCFKESKTQKISNLPDSYTEISSGLGGISPKHLLAVPVVFDDIKEGVIEVTSFNEVEDFKRVFLEKLAETLASTINALKKNEQIQEMLIANQEDTEELRSQEEEMRQNIEEMHATQEEMQRNQVELEESVVLLKKLKKELKEKDKTIAEIDNRTYAIINSLEVAVYWKNSKLEYVGCNTKFAKLMGFNEPKDVSGLTDKDLPWSKGAADKKIKIDKALIESGESVLDTEEHITIGDGKKSLTKTSKILLKNKKEEVTGLIGVFEFIKK